MSAARYESADALGQRRSASAPSTGPARHGPDRGGAPPSAGASGPVATRPRADDGRRPVDDLQARERSPVRVAMVALRADRRDARWARLRPDRRRGSDQTRLRALVSVGCGLVNSRRTRPTSSRRRSQSATRRRRPRRGTRRRRATTRPPSQGSKPPSGKPGDAAECHRPRKAQARCARDAASGNHGRRAASQAASGNHGRRAGAGRRAATTTAFRRSPPPSRPSTRASRRTR